MTATTIDEVIKQLGDIVDRSRYQRSRLGYFAALYRRMTIEVKKGIDSGRFEDGPRMERLDVIFANRYLEALEGFRRGEDVSRCWLASFRTASMWRPLVLQHLIMGMYSHINLDLGIATAETCPGDQLPGLKRDFDEINKLLASLIDEVQAKIASFSPWIDLGDRIAGPADEMYTAFSLNRDRDAAWELAERLAPLGPEEKKEVIAQRDLEVEAHVIHVRDLRKFLRLMLLIVRLRESGNVPKIMDALE